MINTVAACLLFLVGVLPAGAGGHSENTYVKTSVSFSRPTVQPGDTIDVTVQFTPADGIHIVGHPPVRIDIDSTNILSIGGFVRQPVDETTGYLLADTPVRQPFRVLPHSRPGAYAIAGTCTYMFCSDGGGWCRRFSQPIALTLTITK
jgi:hypothetical protein